MKIALQVGAPGQEEWASFVRQHAGSHARLQDLPGEATVSAYDQDRLVGLGWIRAESDEDQPALHFDIAPEYERRGIRTHMSKLLLPMTRKLAQTARQLA